MSTKIKKKNKSCILANAKQERVGYEINFVDSSLGKPSPYILDLKKIVDERTKENAVLTQEEKAFDPSPLLELTLFSVLLDLARFCQKILKRIYGLIKKIILGIFRYLINKTRLIIDYTLRFFQFFKFSFVEYKKIAGFGLLAFIFILPLQFFSYYETLKIVEDKTLSVAENAYGSFLLGGKGIINSDFEAAAQNFSQAAKIFGQAQDELKKVNFLISNLIKALPQGGSKFKTGEALLFAGEKFSWVGEMLSNSLDNFFIQDNEKKLTQKIKILRNRLNVILPEVAVAAEKLSKIKSEFIPEDKREVFGKLKSEMPNLIGSLRSLISISDLMIKFLGDEEPKRYLFIFQNPGEIRPTGGFIGSIALVDFDCGEIINLEIPGGGPYDLQGSLREKIASPEPMQLINARWELQDANWFPDFPSSAQKIKWFYEKAGGPTIDGVIAVNANLVVDLLSVVGPIDMPEYGKTISHENFIEEIQKVVEIEYDKKENKPKQIIADLAPKLIEKILRSEVKDFGKILNILAKAMHEKDILLYSVFPTIEHEIINFGLGGQMKTVIGKTDYLMVVHTNIGGEKTDWVIDENINLEVKISDDGYIKNKLVINRTHRGTKGKLFTGVRNVDYLRIYVPLGSTLLSASGFEAPPQELFKKPSDDYKIDLVLKNYEEGALIDASSGTKITKEFGKTVFGNWVQVDPGEEVTVTLEYLLPFKLSFIEAEKGWFDDLLGGTRKSKNFYQILVQKQPGKKATFTGKVIFPEKWHPILQYGDGLQVSELTAKIFGHLNTDKFYLIGFE